MTQKILLFQVYDTKNLPFQVYDTKKLTVSAG